MSAAGQPLLILGTGSFAAEVADVVCEIPGWTVTGFVESLDRTHCLEKLEGLPILWLDEIASLSATHRAIAALGTTRRDQLIRQVRAFGFDFATLVHPTARVSAASSLGEGTLVSVASVIAAHAQLGRHVLVNRGVLIGHHTLIGDYATLSPGANVAGACHIGEATYVGMGAVLIDHTTVGAHSVIAAGAVVTRDVPDHVMVAGVPAKIIKEHTPGL